MSSGVMNVSALPGHPVSATELQQEGFVPLTLQFRGLGVDLPCGRGCEWTTVGEVPSGPGVYAFTVEASGLIHVTYVGLSEEIWMVTKGRLPEGGARPGQRYGRPRYAAENRQRINVLVAEQVALNRSVRHWTKPVPEAGVNPTDRAILQATETGFIDRWNLRIVGWNRR